MNRLKSEKEFLDLLVSNFPQIKDDLLDEDFLDSITLQIGVFMRLTQHAIDNLDELLMKRAFNFVNDNMGKTERKVENALVITYLGHLNFDANMGAKIILPDSLRVVYDELKKYHLKS